MQRRQPLSLGTVEEYRRDPSSYFYKICVYDRDLSTSQVAATYAEGK